MINKKKSYTLGICNSITSSACLFSNGSLIAAVSEERFTRKKDDVSFPLKSIKYVLKHAKINLNNVDHVAYSWAKGFNPYLKFSYVKRAADFKKISNKVYKLFSERIKWEKKRDKKKLKQFKEWKKKSLTKSQIKSTVVFYHHESHAASAALLSPFEKGIVVTADARGDYESFTISLFNRKDFNSLTKIYSATSSDSLGFFYGRITGLLGFKPMRHEGKITGLAAHGNPSKARSLMRSMITVKKGKIIASLGDYYKPFFFPYSQLLVSKIKKYSREDVAAAAQEHLEWCISEMVKYYFKKLKLSPMPLMLAGGTFGNVKVTHALKSLPFITDTFVQPQMSDGGLCIGAAALLLHSRKFKVYKLKNVYLGPSINNFDKNKWQNKLLNFKIKKINLIEDEICKDLFNNKVVGLVRGRMEFGPRALCHRSIIYKTSDESINDWLNKRMGRNEFMPFAPVIRNETAKRAFKKYTAKDLTLSFMTSTIDCSNEFSKKNPAVTHIDQTARPQIIYKNDDPFMWSLLSKWEKISGEMSLVNTSFNAHEEPIICNERDAIKVLTQGMIDVLYVENNRIASKE